MLIFLDLDGTVLGPNGISPAVANAAKAARDAGFLLSVCTGRPRGGVAQTIAQSFGAGPHIFENGAMIAAPTGRPEVLESLPQSVALSLARHARDVEAVLEFYTPAGVFVSRYNTDCEEHEQILGIRVEEADLEDVARQRPIMRAHWIMRPLTRHAALALDLDEVEVGEATSPVLPGMLFASITPQGVSKGTAVAWVAAHHGVELADCVGVGDAPGDRPMLDAVGHPYVMGNAPPELHRDYPVLPSVELDGVATLLNRFLEAK
ncbi:MAG: HAD family hydrolase [bacterium]